MLLTDDSISPSENPDLFWKSVSGEHGTPVRLITALHYSELYLTHGQLELGQPWEAKECHWQFRAVSCAALRSRRHIDDVTQIGPNTASNTSPIVGTIHSVDDVLTHARIPWKPSYIDRGVIVS
jgi:hypothetical protein